MLENSAKDSSFNKTVAVPRWLVTNTKFLLPAFAALTTAWVGIKLLQLDVDKLKENIPSVERKVYELERKLDIMQLSNENVNTRIGDGLCRVDNSVQALTKKIEEFSVQQQQTQTDVRVIQEQLKGKGL